MKRILVTGMSGVGKSSVIAELATRGYQAVDADNDEYSVWAEVAADSGIPGSPLQPGRDWVWREDRMAALLDAEAGDCLFVSGCASNMGLFLPRFDHIVLLHAPAERIIERLRTRTTNPFGKDPAELAHVLDSLETIEPLLRRIATHHIDTAVTDIEMTADMLLRIAQS